jgi:hypothetical protein
MHNSVSAPRIELRLARGCLGGTYGQESSQESSFEVQDEARETKDGESQVESRFQDEAQGPDEVEAAKSREKTETNPHPAGRHHREDGKRHSRRGGWHQGNSGHAREDASSGDA